jgi:hypothetical protein
MRVAASYQYAHGSGLGSEFLRSIPTVSFQA